MESAAINKPIREWSGIQRDDFDRDLNAIHEAESLLHHEQKSIYHQQLHQITKRDKIWQWHADAAQRAEALLRTINKWDDQ